MFDKLIDLIISMWERIQPVVFIMGFDQGVVFRGGKFHTVWNPGPHFRIPGIDVIVTANVTHGSLCIREVNATTKDGKTISIAAQFSYKITDIKTAIVLTNDWQAVIVNAGRRIMSKELAKYDWETIYNGKANSSIETLIEKEAELLGIEIWDFDFTDKLIIRGFKLFNA